MKNVKNTKRLLILLIILVIVAGGFFYFWYVWLPQAIERQEQEDRRLFQDREPPTLFAKEDYQVEDRADGKYIVVEKVGLTCKVPDGWRIEIEGDDVPEPEYWVNLSSHDAEVKDILIKGCGISIMAGVAEKKNIEIKQNIKSIQENPEVSEEIRENYNLEVVKIDNYQSLKWLSVNDPILGQASGIDIPMGKKELLSFDTRFPPEYQEKCSPIWEEFLESVVIK